MKIFILSNHQLTVFQTKGHTDLVGFISSRTMDDFKKVQTIRTHTEFAHDVDMFDEVMITSRRSSFQKEPRDVFRANEK
jgi:hypothetical protein